MIRYSHIRAIEVLIGPLPEYQGGGAVSQALRFYADGSSSNLRIKFSITKHIASTATPTTVDIYNLSAKTRNDLRKSELLAVINVGRAGSGLVQIFRGALMNSTSKRDGTDIKTTFLCIPGFGATSRAVLNKTWAENTALVDILTDLANELQGVSKGNNSIKITDINMGSQGYSCAGAVRTTLDKLARAYGFSWWINSGVFYALDDNRALAGSSIQMNSDNGYLLRAEPMLATPMQKKVGVSVNSFLHPQLDPGRFMTLKSGINPDLDGDYKIHTLNHAGDSNSSEWTSTAQSWIVGGV